MDICRPSSVASNTLDLFRKFDKKLIQSTLSTSTITKTTNKMAETVEQTENTTSFPLKVNFTPDEPVTFGYAHVDSFNSIEKYDPFIQNSPNRK